MKQIASSLHLKPFEAQIGRSWLPSPRKCFWHVISFKETRKFTYSEIAKFIFSADWSIVSETIVFQTSDAIKEDLTELYVLVKVQTLTGNFVARLDFLFQTSNFLFWFMK